LETYVLVCMLVDSGSARTKYNHAGDLTSDTINYLIIVGTVNTPELKLPFHVQLIDFLIK